MIEVSFAAAFFGGILALLSPCSALLLPAFFAYAFQNRTELIARTFLFYLGLATIFVPLGMGATLATSLFLDNRETMIVVAGVVLIAFGILELSGRTIGLPFFSGSGAGSGAAETKNLFGTYTLGLVYGFGGFCSGPILGSVLTVAAAGDNALRGGGLLAIYALGTVLPLFIIASLWDSTGVGKAKWLRGWGVNIGPLAIHSTNLIAGTVFVLLGLSFIFLDGTNALSGLYSGLGFTELSFQADERIKDLTSWIPDGVFIAAVLTALAAGVWYIFRYFGRDQADSSEEGQSDVASETPRP
ncbi:MAG: cytochrome c biogenesis protein CcdA [Chloroflexi bacterium]|nr:MAG: cytochrome c biogenesis protein CcdA [Chloroflexota bacterium]